MATSTSQAGQHNVNEIARQILDHPPRRISFAEVSYIEPFDVTDCPEDMMNTNTGVMVSVPGGDNVM
jgi:hypothetical protein